MAKTGTCEIKNCNVYGLLYGPTTEGMVCITHLNNRTADTGCTDRKQGKKTEEKAKAKSQDQWFKEKLKAAPKTCECCGQKITLPEGMPKTKVAHIFPKAVFKSVRTHPENYWYATWQHHTTYDSSTWDEKRNLPIWPKIQDRIQKVINDMAETELRHLPEFLRAMRNTNQTNN